MFEMDLSLGVEQLLERLTVYLLCTCMPIKSNIIVLISCIPVVDVSDRIGYTHLWDADRGG